MTFHPAPIEQSRDGPFREMHQCLVFLFVDALCNCSFVPDGTIARVTQEPSDALVIGDNNALYFSNFKPCIMPGEHANADGHHENRDADRTAASQMREESTTRDSFA